MLFYVDEAKTVRLRKIVHFMKLANVTKVHNFQNLQKDKTGNFSP
jgi:hypothetical protein